MRLMEPLRTAALALAVSSFALASPVAADVKVKLEPFVSGVNAPLAMVQPAGDARMFVIEQHGLVRIIEDGEMLDEPFINIRHKLVDLHHDFDERGLLGIAFHPKFAENGKFYLAYSGPLNFQADLGKMLWYSHTNFVSEFTVSSITLSPLAIP